MKRCSIAEGYRYRLSSTFSVILMGCTVSAVDQSSDTLGVSSEALVVTNCTGAAISAAVAAGGDVLLDCGPNPVTVSMPRTTVTHLARLHPRVAGSVTLTSPGLIFDISSNAAFEVDNLKFMGGGDGASALHTTSGSASVIGCTFNTYRSQFALSVHSSAARLTVSSSTFSANGTSSGTFASPIYVEGSSAEVRDSTFANNLSGASGGAITSVGGGNITVSGSTFLSNFANAGGAIYLSGVGGTYNITNSTFVTNHGNSDGGAIFNQTGTPATVRNCTFSNSGSPSGTLTGAFQVFNSILLDTVTPSSASCQLGGSGNIEWPTTLALCGPGFRYGNPLLGSLANNGGPTQTMALNPGSAAIDSAVGACPPTDQRSFARPRDGDGNGSLVCDVGAYER